MSKLVRNKIPQIIEKSGKSAPFHILTDQEYKEQLFIKIVEEAQELYEGQNIEEIADVQEVLIEIKKAMKLSDLEVISKMDSKRESNGGFDQKICLDLNTSSKILNNVRIIQKCIIVRDDGKILALKRAADDHSRGGNWDLPGGGYEQGEEIVSAIKREIVEEVGLIALNPQPIFVDNHMNIKTGFFAGLNVFGICYVCTKWEGLPAQSGEVKISEEHTEFQWITPEEFITLSFGEDNGFFVASMKAYLSLPAPI